MFDTQQYVPQSASAGCKTYLSSLDSASAISTCVAPLLAAATTLSKADGASASSALGSLCAQNVGCDDATIRAQLDAFYTACSSDLSSDSTSADTESLKLNYDTLYILNPLRNAICARDASNNYCLLSMASSNQTSLADEAVANATAPATAQGAYKTIKDAAKAALGSLSTSLRRRAETDSNAVPDATKFTSTGAPFVFLTGALPQQQLCTFCARAIMASYIAWEQQLPYQLGLASSPLLAGQQKLWSGMNSTCGPNYMASMNALAGTAATSAAGSLSPSTASMASALILAAGVAFWF